VFGLINSRSGLWKSEKELLEVSQEWFGMLRGDGRLGRKAEEFCRESGRNGDGEDDGDSGVDGEFETKPRSFLALKTTEWTSDSGPKAKRIISFSPWS